MDFFSRYLDTLRKRHISDYPPTQVVEVKPEEYIQHTPYQREDSLILYGLQPTNVVSYSVGNANISASFTADGEGNVTAMVPNMTSSSIQALATPIFEVVFYKDTPKSGNQTAFSLVRAPDIDIAKRYFDKFIEILPHFSTSCPGMVNVDILQDICNYLRDHPNQSLAHLAANYNMTDCFKHQVVQQQISLADPETNMTPLLIATKGGKKETVQAVLSLNPSVDITDKDGFNVLHHAASTSKEVISLVCQAIITSSNQTLDVNSITVPLTSPPLSPKPVNSASSSDPPSRDESLLLRMINSRNKNNATPLHLACLSDKPDCVKELLKNGADVNGACMESKDSSRDRTPSRKPRRKLPQVPGSTNNGLAVPTPNQPDISPSESNNNMGFDKIMIEHLNPKDMKNGGNPLHWAKSPQCMEPLIEMGCDINAKNFQGETVLHVMVSRRQIPCVVTLLTYGADVNEKGPNGVTPLHVAARLGDVTVVQALVVFGAKLNEENSAGESPRHLAATSKRTPAQDMILFVLNSVGAKRCTRSRITTCPCTDGCSPTGHFNGSPIDPSPFSRIHSIYDPLLGRNIIKAAVAKKKRAMRASSPPSKSFGDDCTPEADLGKQRGMSMESDSSQEGKNIRLLCLDGGGIRGLVLIQMLSFLEDFLGCPTYEIFDWIAGTSTGGILALAIASGNSAAQCREYYFKMKNKVFFGTRPYESEPLDNFLKKLFGESTSMADILKPRVMLTATVADRFPAELHLFRNYPAPEEILGSITTLPSSPRAHEMLLWAAARGSGAAPTYFRPCGRYLDGGLISNNPTLDILTEITYVNACLEQTGQTNEKYAPSVVVSLGTGAPPVSEIPVIDVFRPDSLVGVAKIAMMATSLGQLLVDQASQSDGQVVERARAWCHSMKLPYFRANPPLSENINMDETNNVKLINMLWETQAYMTSRKEEFDELRTLLLQ